MISSLLVFLASKESKEREGTYRHCRRLDEEDGILDGLDVDGLPWNVLQDHDARN